MKGKIILYCLNSTVELFERVCDNYIFLVLKKIFEINNLIIDLRKKGLRLDVEPGSISCNFYSPYLEEGDLPCSVRK